jgi:hypothetical protein
MGEFIAFLRSCSSHFQSLFYRNAAYFTSNHRDLRGAPSQMQAIDNSPVNYVFISNSSTALLISDNHTQTKPTENFNSNRTLNHQLDQHTNNSRCEQDKEL